MNIRKIFTAGLALSLMTAAFAFESSAKITLEGNIVEQTQKKNEKPVFNFLNLNPISSKSKNSISLDVDAGIAGAHFELFYLLTGASKAEDGWAVKAGGTHIWFTPVDMLKIRLGYVGDDSYFVETVDGERVVNPFNIDDRGTSKNHPAYITNADVDEMGLSITVSPFDFLSFSAAVAPGIGKAFITASDDENNGKYTQWGVGAKYNLNENIAFQLSYRDNGKDNWKVIRAGAGFENDSITAFIQPVFGIDYITAETKHKLTGIGIDLFGQYRLDAWTFTAHLPVTIRTTGDAADPSYMEALLQVKYNLGYLGLFDDFTPYLTVRTQNNTPFTLDADFANSLGMNIQPGVSMKIGGCSIDTGFCAQINNGYSTLANFTWSVPFSVSLAF